MRTLSERYQIGNSTRLLESIDASDEVVAKVTSQQENLTQFLRRRRQDASGESAWQSVSSLEWLEYCTVHGLLVPNRWTQSLIEAHLDLLALTTERPFIIDGYPRDLPDFFGPFQSWRTASVASVEQYRCLNSLGV
ncbi:hypothetical protein, partial [Burkholderia gladioli]|uniref:hypothetical protein n=1 Tax=Burkholderia gladioli TaxID=28095 RepID=UPI001ABAD75D